MRRPSKTRTNTCETPLPRYGCGEMARDPATDRADGSELRRVQLDEVPGPVKATLARFLFDRRAVRTHRGAITICRSANRGALTAKLYRKICP